MNISNAQIKAFPSQTPYTTSKYFSQVNASQTINYRCNPKYDTIQVTSPLITITQMKTIHTIIGTSLEGQTLSGKKLLVGGYANLVAVLKQCACDTIRNHSISICIPFSTYIVIPIDTCECNSIWIEYYIEDQSAFILNPNSIYVTVSLLLSYHNCEM